ncbi:MAG: hypothetical protein IKO10_12870, partial [Lachnospiraceae bacterium]|nr:hypothetical protein [Lachnospiraceae bacterium]
GEVFRLFPSSSPSAQYDKRFRQVLSRMADGLEILQLKLYRYEFSSVLARLNSTLFLLKAKGNLLFHFSIK